MRNLTKAVKVKGVFVSRGRFSFLHKVIQKMRNLTKAVKVKGVFVSRGEFSP
jgi:hypothetical protein